MGGSDIQQAQRKQIMEYTVILLLVIMVEHGHFTRCQNVFTGLPGASMWKIVLVL